jgi:hypothetical protein
MFPIPKSIVKGKIIKNKMMLGNSRYDFQYTDKYGYKNTLGGLSHMFKPEFWNYARLISAYCVMACRQRMLWSCLFHELDNESINTWKNGVERSLKRYIPNGTKAKGKCDNCGSTNLVYQKGASYALTVVPRNAAESVGSRRTSRQYQSAVPVGSKAVPSRQLQSSQQYTAYQSAVRVAKLTCTTARPHDSTTARPHDRTTARLHDRKTFRIPVQLNSTVTGQSLLQ